MPKPGFLSTLSLRRATPYIIRHAVNLHSISIHALLAESDYYARLFQLFQHQISIHALLAESDMLRVSVLINLDCISIHALLAESDVIQPPSTLQNLNFYPRSPCGERPLFTSCKIDVLYFYPRSPCGERRDLWIYVAIYIDISIHALLAESDVVVVLHIVSRADFYPRSPCGERPAGSLDDILAGVFLSTLSLRRATITA